MELSIHEKVVIVILAVFLAAGAVILYSTSHRSHQPITIVENGINEELTLTEVRKRLIERQKVNVNTASIAEMTVIPGIGMGFAERIITYRSEHGKFYNKSDLLKVKGIGAKKLNKMKEYVKCEG